MPKHIPWMLICCLLLTAGAFLPGCGSSVPPEQSFSLRTNFDEFSDEEIDAILLGAILDSFSPDEWDFIVLMPAVPIQDSTFIQVGAPTENVDYQYTVEIGFETKEEGLTLYRMYTRDKALILQWVVEYCGEQEIPDILTWEDVTWELGPA